MRILLKYSPLIVGIPYPKNKKYKNYRNFISQLTIGSTLKRVCAYFLVAILGNGSQTKGEFSFSLIFQQEKLGKTQTGCFDKPLEWVSVLLIFASTVHPMNDVSIILFMKSLPIFKKLPWEKIRHWKKRCWCSRSHLWSWFP